MPSRNKFPLISVLTASFLLLNTFAYSRPAQNSSQLSNQLPPVSASDVQEKVNQASAKVDRKNTVASLSIGTRPLDIPLSTVRSRKTDGSIRTVYYWRDEIIAVQDPKEGSYLFKRENALGEATYAVTFKSRDGKISIAWKNVTVTLVASNISPIQLSILVLPGNKEVRGVLESFTLRGQDVDTYVTIGSNGGVPSVETVMTSGRLPGTRIIYSNIRLASSDGADKSKGEQSLGIYPTILQKGSSEPLYLIGRPSQEFSADGGRADYIYGKTRFSGKNYWQVERFDKTDKITSAVRHYSDFSIDFTAVHGTIEANVKDDSVLETLGENLMNAYSYAKGSTLTLTTLLVSEISPKEYKYTFKGKIFDVITLRTHSFDFTLTIKSL